MKRSEKRLYITVFLCTLLLALWSVQRVTPTTLADDPRSWPQWGQDAQHAGSVSTIGQAINNQLAEITYDPLVPDEQASEGGSLLAHYQVPILDGEDVFMEFKTGTFDPNNPNFNTESWHQHRLHWEDDQLVTKWVFDSDWKPMPIDFVGGWEPVYHGALSNGRFYDPGFGGTIFKLNRGDGTVISRINPFEDGLLKATRFTASPLSADQQGNIYYNVIELNNLSDEVTTGSWLVKVGPDDQVSKVSYSTLVPDAPSTCVGRFTNSQLPWPPSPTATPTFTFPCGLQRAGVNVAPAIAPDGTIYTVARVDNSARYGWVVAVNPDLTRKWDTSMRNLFRDGCGVLIPIATSATPTKGTCRFGAVVTGVNFGVDPTTNRPGDGSVLDESSSSPTVLPDGNVLYGAYTRYNIARGHLIKFNGATGAVMANFDFGWDTTPAVFSHDGTYSIVIKDNHYDEEAGFYCNPTSGASLIVCAFTGIPAGPFYITQLNANLRPEWKFHNIETQSCTRNPDGSLTCVTDHPNGFEWCINAPAIDGNQTVYVNSEDGHLYTIPQGRTGVFDINSAGPKAKRLFLRLAIGAAYTPLSIGKDGKIYTENAGDMFVIGNGN